MNQRNTYYQDYHRTFYKVIYFIILLKYNYMRIYYLESKIDEDYYLPVIFSAK